MGKSLVISCFSAYNCLESRFLTATRVLLIQRPRRGANDDAAYRRATRPLSSCLRSLARVAWVRSTKREIRASIARSH